MAKKILVALAVVVVILVAVIAMQPANFTIKREATVAAPPSVVFAQVNDFKRWADWSPWDKMDPSMKRTYTGAPAGVGAHYGWVGNDKVGEGAMTIDSVKENEHIAITLEFIKPFAAKNQTEFDFKADGTGTHVTWAMSGSRGFLEKAFGLVMDMDKLVGGDFEKGLGSMKTLAEAEAAKAVAAPATADDGAKPSDAAAPSTDAGSP